MRGWISIPYDVVLERGHLQEEIHAYKGEVFYEKGVVKKKKRKNVFFPLIISPVVHM